MQNARAQAKQFFIILIPLRSSSSKLILSKNLNTRVFSSSLLSLAGSFVNSKSIFLPPNDKMNNNEEAEEAETLMMSPSCK